MLCECEKKCVIVLLLQQINAETSGLNLKYFEKLK